MKEVFPTYTKCLESFLQQNELNVDIFLRNQKKLLFPLLDKAYLLELLSKCEERFKSEPVLLNIRSPIVIVGDIHGQYLDLIRILSDFSLPPTSKYLFLGDLVDRGEFSIEVTILVCLLKLEFPDHVYIIRGNHEFKELWNMGGFLNEILDQYDQDVVDAFESMFSFLPMSAIVNDSIICLHGGICPHIKYREQLESIERPIFTFDDKRIAGILWSDPTASNPFYTQSQRGVGVYYGETALSQFLSAHNLKFLIRGHQCVQGVEITLNGLCHTVFSASNYCGKTRNKGGVIFIDKQGYMLTTFYEPMSLLLRTAADFFYNDNGTVIIVKGKTSSRTNIEQVPQFTDRLPQIANKSGANQVTTECVQVGYFEKRRVKFSSSRKSINPKKNPAPIVAPANSV